jgi:hypothetical protein
MQPSAAPRALLAGLLLLLAAAAPAAGAEPPPALIEATEAASAACQAAGGTPRILPGYEVARDLNGDGRPDFLTDLAGLECAGAWDTLCTARGCPVTAWLSAPTAGHDRFELGPLRGFSVREDDTGGLPAVVTLHDAADCGPEATGDCTRTWRFTSNAPDTPPPDAPPPDTRPAEPPPPAEATATPTPPALAGWTLRRVPGASPVALGAGPGDLASLAAFCLEGQPFLALTFHDRPESASVTLDFAFSQGPLSATAGFESTAGGAYVVALADSALAARLAGRDSEVEVKVDGRPAGTLSLKGSTRALRGALADCHGF